MADVWIQLRRIYAERDFIGRYMIWLVPGDASGLLGNEVLLREEKVSRG